MWIKHNNSIYNTNYILKIEAVRTKLIATFSDGSKEVIGSFKSTKNCNDICQSIVKSLLFENPEFPGIIIKDTKPNKKQDATDRKSCKNRTV